jgi:uncharacterized protein DUF4136
MGQRGSQPARDRCHPDQILDAQIRQSIDSQLVAKGFTKVDSDKADVFVAYQVALDREMQWTASGWGDRPWGLVGVRQPVRPSPLGLWCCRSMIQRLSSRFG